MKLQNAVNWPPQMWKREVVKYFYIVMMVAATKIVPLNCCGKFHQSIILNYDYIVYVSRNSPTWARFGF